jgi:hypothetical protein
LQASLARHAFSSARRCGYHRDSQRSKAMKKRNAVLAYAVLILAWIASPATAGEHWRSGHGGHWGNWRATHNVIYQLGNSIALLEADPEIDDGYKAPIITGARAEIMRLRASLPPARWRWTVPCCYSRRPIHIR